MKKYNPYTREQTVELIHLTAERLGLQEPAVIEKDLYVTQAISVLQGVVNETFKLIFQGGTALAKAHKLIQRMSEDCDFRIAYRQLNQTMAKDVQRKKLRAYRYDLVSALKNHGFKLQEDAVRVRNEGQFVCIRAEYPSVHGVPSVLKPFVALEFFLDDVKTPVVGKVISTLVRETLGERIQHASAEVECMSISETAAEKWVALTRRVITAKEKDRYYSQALVRHIYDLHMIDKHSPLGEEFTDLAVKVVEGDRNHFKKHSNLYYADPVKAIKHSLSELEENLDWQSAWNAFIEAMVYGDKLTYEEAMETLRALSELVLKSLSQAS